MFHLNNIRAALLGASLAGATILFAQSTPIRKFQIEVAVPDFKQATATYAAGKSWNSPIPISNFHLVFLNGVYQPPSRYTVTGASINFTQGYPDGTNPDASSEVTVVGY